MDFITTTFWNSYFKILVKPHYEGNDDHQCCWSSVRHFGALTIKFPPDPILAQNMANLQNSLTGLLFTVFRWSIFAYHVRNILKSLLWNFYLIKLRLITCLVFKILSHASDSSFTATPIVLTITTRLCSSYREIVTYPDYNATKMADLQNSVTRPLIIVFIQLFSAYRQSATLELSLIHIWRCRRRG